MNTPNNSIIVIREKLLLPLLVCIVGGLITGYLLYSYLGRIDLEYYVDTNLSAQTGLKTIDPNIPDLAVDISKIKFRGKEFDTLHLLTFRIINKSQEHMPKDSIFYIQSEAGKLPEDSIIAIIINPQDIRNEIILANSRSYDTNYGHNFIIESSLPGESYISVSALIDSSELNGINPESILLKKVTRSRERLERLFSTESKITFSYLQLIILILMAAFCYGGFWLSISILRHNYSTGMEIIDNISSFFFKKKIFLKNIKEFTQPESGPEAKGKIKKKKRRESL